LDALTTGGNLILPSCTTDLIAKQGTKSSVNGLHWGWDQDDYFVEMHGAKYRSEILPHEDVLGAVEMGSPADDIKEPVVSGGSTGIVGCAKSTESQVALNQPESQVVPS
jgi:hypothetical protein